MPARSIDLELPSSYSTLPFKEIRLSHCPASSVEPTPIVVLTLYRPNNYNAFTDTMMEEIEHAYALFSVDPRVKCIVMTGHGKMYCAGADLQVGFKTMDAETEIEHRDGGGRVTLAIHRCTKPTIGAIQGAAVGVGITMTLPMNIRVAYRGAKIGFVFGRRGLAMEAASSYFLPRLIGLSRVMHLVTTGAVYRADDKLMDGLFTELVDSPEETLPRALQIAEEVVQNVSTVSTYMMKEMIWRGPGSAEEAHLLDSRILHGLRQSVDNKEGVQAFLEKRPAVFTGTLQNSAPNVYPWWTPVNTSNLAKAATKRSKL